MQDGSALPADEAGEWLRTHVKDEPHTGISIAWEAREKRDDAGFARLLSALFTPLPDGPGS